MNKGVLTNGKKLDFDKKQKKQKQNKNTFMTQNKYHLKESVRMCKCSWLKSHLFQKIQ